MIQKIKSVEYLKRCDNMSGAERQSLGDRVGQWLRSGARLLARRAEEPDARMLNVMQVSAGWNDQECAAWEEGARLLTAFSGVTDTWLPEMIYVKAAKRSIRRMTEVLKGQGCPHPLPVKDGSGRPQEGGAGERNRRIEEENANKAAKEDPAKTNGNGRDKIAVQQTMTAQASSIVPRPKHIDQYVHLLPEKTQERAAQYGPLKREIEAARENMRLLMNDPHSSAQEREKWAKLAARNDEKIARINAELDREWEKVAATGRVAVDDLGMAHIIGPETGGDSIPQAEPAAEPSGEGIQEPAAEPAAEPAQEPKRKPGRPAMTEEEKKAAAEKRAEEKAAGKEARKKAEDDKRREYLKKWLRDTRTAPSDERCKQWKKNCRELVELGGEITDSIRKAGEYYGADPANL